MRFVLACAVLFPPSVGDQLTRQVWSFVTARMCEAQRSRILCQLSLLEDWTERERVPTPPLLTSWDEALLCEIHKLSRKTHPLWTTSAFHAWHQRTNWRGQNLLKFAVYPIPLDAELVADEPPAFEVLFRLPDFAYDRHTRVGKRTCRRICGIAAVAQFFREHPTQHMTETIGWALFLLEGGVVQNGLVDHRLSLLEQRFLASRWGWTLDTWDTFQTLMSGLLRDGVINQIRTEVLRGQSYCS
jgi:hypothetical protein